MASLIEDFLSVSYPANMLTPKLLKQDETLVFRPSIVKDPFRSFHATKRITYDLAGVRAGCPLFFKKKSDNQRGLHTLLEIEQGLVDKPNCSFHTPTMPAHLAVSRGYLHRLDAQAVAVPEEQNTLATADGTLTWLDPLAPPGALPHGLDEANGAILGVCAVVLAHNRLNSLGSLISVIKGNGADIMVQDVGLDNTVEEVAADESKLAVDGGGGAAHEVPLVGGIVGKRRIGVLQEGDGN